MDVKSAIEIVHEIKNSKEKNKVDVFTKKYPGFVEQCPKLFEAACDDMFPMTYLEMMTQQINMLNSKTTNIDSANNVIFKTLNEKYVDHLVEAQGDERERC